MFLIMLPLKNYLAKTYISKAKDTLFKSIWLKTKHSFQRYSRCSGTILESVVCNFLKQFAVLSYHENNIVLYSDLVYYFMETNASNHRF